MNLTKILLALDNLAQWVKDGLTKKQSKALVKTADPVAGDGNDGDICLVVDP